MGPLQVDRDSPIPIFQQIAQQLRAGIWQGRWHEGATLPPEVELAAQFGVARSTIRQAIQQLVREGHLRRQRGRGTFIIRVPVQSDQGGPRAARPLPAEPPPAPHGMPLAGVPSGRLEELTPLADTLKALWSDFWITAQRQEEQGASYVRRMSRWGKEMQALQLQFGAQLEQMQDLLTELHGRLSPTREPERPDSDHPLAAAVTALARGKHGGAGAWLPDLDELGQAIYRETAQALDACQSTAGSAPA